MSNKKIGLCIRVAVVIVTLAGILLCAFWYPFDVSFSTLPWQESPTAAQTGDFYGQLAFYWAVSLPCFIIMAFIWNVSTRIRRGELFSFEIYKYLKISAIMLFADCGVFFAGNTVFYFLDRNPFFLIYLIIGLVGVAFALCATALAYLAKNAAILKEDNDSIL
ncbi:MAG: DUF2975 domain-containing protein [Clostridia bacterium]|nr:DUF2975 domain-containing protein [Clostridia bacterium]